MSRADHETSDAPTISPVGRFRAALNNPYVARITLSVLILNACVIAWRMVPIAGMTRQNSVCHALLEICGVFIAGGIASGLWVQYWVTTKRKYLLSTMALSGLMFAGLAHALTSAAASHGWTSLQDVGFQYYFVWKFAAGFLLIASALTTAEDSKSSCRKSGLRSLVGTMALSVLLTAALVAIGRAHFHPANSIHTPIAEWLSAVSRWATSPLPIRMLGLGVIVAALAAFARRYIEEEDRFSDAFVRSLVLVTAAAVSDMTTQHAYDLAWWISHVFMNLALLTLLIELGHEFGISYANSQSRIEHLEAVHRISSQLGTTLDLRVVLYVLVSDIADLLSARYASVMLVDDAGETLKSVATHGLPESPLRSSEPQQIEENGRPAFHSGHTARAFREKRVCIVDDVFTDVEFVPWKVLAQCDGYAVSAPLVYQDVALGVLTLFFDAHVPLNDERIRLFETLASAAAVSVANAQLYDRALESHPSDADTANLFRLRLAS
ncbi:MAG: GAF domain-containing protein [Armatimonadetes bacterium]|nr:GAF domain-containing protein [Armatimonadota bacterium]